MALNLNKVLLAGNLTRDPQLTYLPSNTPVVEFALACNRRFRRQDGEQGEETLFIDCRAYGRTAEVINQYMQKGRPIFVEGRLQLDKWQDKEGNNRQKHRVIVDNFQFVESRESAHHDGGSDGENHAQSNRGAAPQMPARAAAPATHHEPAPEMPEDDIPF